MTDWKRLAEIAEPPIPAGSGPRGSPRAWSNWKYDLRELGGQLPIDTLPWRHPRKK